MRADPIKKFVETYHTRCKFEEDTKLPIAVINSHMIEVKGEVRKALLRDKMRNFWKK